MRLALLLSLLVAPLAFAQGIPLKSGAGTDLATVDTNKNLRVVQGPAIRPTFVATVTGATTTAAWNLQIESASGTGFKVYEICVSYGLGATAAGTIVTTTVNRRTTASSGGTALTNNGTGTTAVTDLSGGGVGYGGLARGLAATLGTVGATVDQWAHRQNVLAATTAIDPPTHVCRQYGDNGTMPIIVQAGVTNGLSVLVSAGGAGSVAVGSIRVTFVAE